MIKMDKYVFFVTVGNLEEEKKIARALGEEKLVACVNIIQNILSIYRWQGKVERDSEHLLLIKTIDKNIDKIIQKVSELHSYDVPDYIGLKIEKGSEKYLNWISDVVK